MKKTLFIASILSLTVLASCQFSFSTDDQTTGNTENKTENKESDTVKTTPEETDNTADTDTQTVTNNTSETDTQTVTDNSTNETEKNGENEGESGLIITNPVIKPVTQLNKIDIVDIEKPVGLPNPASKFCTENSGTIEIRNNKLGEYGVCIFEDNRQCEEWAFFRGDCPNGGVKVTGYVTDGEIFCAITGGEVQNPGSYAPKCKRVDGKICDTQANLDGECI